MPTPLESFVAARDLLLHHRSDYRRAYDEFRWPRLSTFNWALDYFDVIAADNEAPAPGIVEEDEREERISFAALSRRSSQVAQVRHVIVGADMAQKLDAILGDYTRIVVGEAGAGWRSLSESEAACGDFVPDGPTRADDPLLLYFTSGTTSKRKLVLHSHQSYPVGHLSTMYWIGLQPGDIHLSSRRGTRRPACSSTTPRVSMRSASSRYCSAIASRPCALRRRSGGCSSRRT